MSQFHGFGAGGDGVVSLSGTEAPIDSACTGTATTQSLSATNASFAANQIVLIHQTQGTGAGAWETNQVQAYVAGTITTTGDLINTYGSGAQTRVLKQYSGVTVSSSYTAKAWDGTVGGIIGWLCSGNTTVSNTLSAAGATGVTQGITGAGDTARTSGGGFRGGYGSQGTGFYAAGQGEGLTGVGTGSSSANGIGAGGGSNNVSEAGSSPGGGAGHVAAGSAGSGGDTNNGAAGGIGSDTVDLTTMQFGGGGGGGGSRDGVLQTIAAGGSGGGICFIISRTLTVSGAITVNGGAGGTGTRKCHGGGGAAGSVFIKTFGSILGSGLITATGGAGASGGGATAGSGADGRVRVESCTITGDSTPVSSQVLGGFSFCSVSAGIL